MDMVFEKKLSAALKEDPAYQELLNACLSLENEYSIILRALPGSDQEVLELYISLCEEMDHRMLSIALTLQ